MGKAFEKAGLDEYNLIANKGRGTLSINMSFQLTKDTKAGRKKFADTFRKLIEVRNLLGGVNSQARLVHSDLLGSWEGMNKARENYWEHLKDFHGEEKGKKIYGEASKRARQRNAELKSKGATVYYNERLSGLVQGNRPAGSAGRSQQGTNLGGTGTGRNDSQASIQKGNQSKVSPGKGETAKEILARMKSQDKTNFHIVAKFSNPSRGRGC